MIAIKTQEDEIIFNPARIYAISNYGDYKVVAVDAHKKEHILGIYPTFKRANEEMDCIFHTIDAQAEHVAYAMSEGDE